MPPRTTRPAAPTRSPVAPVHRGPQAANADRASLVPAHAPNAALLIDFDNVTMGIRSDLASELKTLLSSDIVKGRVSIQRAYADWRRYPQYIVPLTESSIDLIFAPAYGSSKKNATDIRLAVDAMELAFTRPDVGTIILLSGDSDFSSLVIKLKEHGKYVIGVGIRESSSDLLVMNCDEYYSYNTLAGLVNIREEETVKWDPWELASEAIQRMKRNSDVMRADRLKQVMQQIDSSFDEKNLGMPKFTRFVTEAAHRGVLSVSKMDNGQYEVDIAKGVTATAEVGDVTVAAGATATVADGATAEAASGEERRPSRSRRGRGRGRDRDDRRPRREAGAEGVDAEGTEGVESATAEGTTDIAIESTPIETVSHAPVSRAPVSALPDVAADGIGLGGMRLTRDEAFDLVRRAVQSIATDDRPAAASAVRRTARELLGRDSESLSDRNFTRILKDSHDADVIDLRRRGNDYEVAPAVAAAPITAQLTAAEAASTPTAAPRSAPLPRGMGPRGVPSRGRGGARGELSLDLLSIGMIDDGMTSTSASTPTKTAPSTPSVAPDAATRVAAPTTRESAPIAAKSARGRKTATKSASKSVAEKQPAKPADKPAAKPAAKSAAKSPARKKTSARSR